jgi:hypothetical protein
LHPLAASTTAARPRLSMWVFMTFSLLIVL